MINNTTFLGPLGKIFRLKYQCTLGAKSCFECSVNELFRRSEVEDVWNVGMLVQNNGNALKVAYYSMIWCVTLKK